MEREAGGKEGGGLQRGPAVTETLCGPPLGGGRVAVLEVVDGLALPGVPGKLRLGRQSGVAGGRDADPASGPPQVPVWALSVGLAWPLLRGGAVLALQDPREVGRPRRPRGSSARRRLPQPRLSGKTRPLGSATHGGLPREAPAQPEPALNQPAARSRGGREEGWPGRRRLLLRSRGPLPFCEGRVIPVQVPGVGCGVAVWGVAQGPAPSPAQPSPHWRF